MKIQATLVIVLLVILVALMTISEWRAMSTTSSSVAPATTTKGPSEFSVTAVADGQYVMRANNKIFYCVNNRCTGIQLINPNPKKPAAATDEGGAAATGDAIEED